MYKSLGIILVSVMMMNFLFILIFVPIHVVGSDSMSPTYRTGDLLLIDKSPSPIQRGDVITYTVKGKTITHRVVAFEGSMLLTQGDNNQAVDVWKTPITAVEGHPFLRLPKVGYLLLFLKSPIGWMVLVLIFITWIFVNELRKISLSPHQTVVR